MVSKISLSAHDIKIVAECMRVAENEGCLNLENPQTLALWIAIMDADMMARCSHLSGVGGG